VAASASRSPFPPTPPWEITRSRPAGTTPVLSSRRWRWPRHSRVRAPAPPLVWARIPYRRRRPRLRAPPPARARPPLP